MRKLCYILLLFLAVNQVSAQSKESLKKEKKKISKEIELTNKLLSENRSKGKVTLDQISLINNKIRLQQRLINTISNQTKSLERDIAKNEKKINELNEEIDVLKKEYASLIELSFKTRDTYSWMMHIFSSESIGEAMRRARYLKEISKLRDRQSLLIEQSQEELSQKNESLKGQKSKKEELLKAEVSQNQLLQEDRSSKQEILSQLKDQEKDLKKKLKIQQEKRRKLAKEIERLIAEEIRKRKKSSNTFSLTPDEEIISGNFAKNKGNLPWPVERGIITEQFGSHPHPELPGIEIVNNGIDISTDVGSSVRALFDGEVTGLITIPGAGLAVMVKHGDYWSVYSNLASTLVEKGEKIDTKQTIGVLMNESNTSKAHLEIWQYTSSGMKKLNPKHWIAQ